MQIAPASLQIQAAPAHLQLSQAVSPPTPARGPVSFSRLDSVGKVSAQEHSQGAEQEEGGAHGSAAPSPPRWSLQEKAKLSQATAVCPRCLLVMD